MYCRKLLTLSIQPCPILARWYSFRLDIGGNEDQISELAIACTNHGLRLVHHGKNFLGYEFPEGVNAISSQNYISEEEHQKVISKAFLTPAL